MRGGVCNPVNCVQRAGSDRLAAWADPALAKQRQAAPSHGSSAQPWTSSTGAGNPAFLSAGGCGMQALPQPPALLFGTFGAAQGARREWGPGPPKKANPGLTSRGKDGPKSSRRGIK